MDNQIIVAVSYIARNGTKGIADVKVDYSEYDKAYYATNLAINLPE